MDKILLPLDGSQCSLAAIPLARELAGQLHAQVILVTVGNLPESAAMAAEEKGQLSTMLANIAAENGLDANFRIELAGDAPGAILQVAEDEGADLIVMATHGRSGLSELAQGSVAQAVVRDGRRPVVLVRPDKSAS